MSLPMSWLGGGIGVSGATRSGVRARLAPEGWAAVGVLYAMVPPGGPHMARTLWGNPQNTPAPPGTTKLPQRHKGQDQDQDQGP